MFDNHLRFSWYAKGILAGSAQPGRFRPLAEDLKELHRKGVRAIVSLHGDFRALPREFADAFSFHSHPVPDGYPPSRDQMKRIIRAVRAEVSRGHPCLVCCRGGVGRTSTVLAVLLMEIGGMTREEAVGVLREAGRVPEGVDQHEFVSRWVVSRRRKGPPPA